MHSVCLVPNSRRDILWLNSKFEMNYTNWNDVVGHWANPPITTPSDAPTAGVYVNLGGTFTTPPVGVAVTDTRLDVFGLGTDYAVYRKTFDASIVDVTKQWSESWERIGGNFMSSPVVLSAGPTQIDIFGLGPDQGLVHISWNGTAWSAFDELGGCFSSPPVVLPAANGAFDIFARAIDYKLYYLAYNPGVQSDWVILGGGLLGEPVAASTPTAIRVQNRIFLFVVGDDGAMWWIIYDGKLWKPWSSLGVAQVAPTGTTLLPTTFFSEPVAVYTPPGISIIPNPISQQSSQHLIVATASHSTPAATAPPITTPFVGRIDVFATGTDGTLFRMWLDSTGWQKAWETPGGSLVCAPSVIRPVSNVIVAQFQGTQFDVLEPGADAVLRLRTFDGETWTYPWPVGPRFSQPNAFSIGVSQVNIASLRSNGDLGETDTDNGTANLSVGRWPIMTAYLDMGDVGTGLHNVDLGMSLNRVSIELCEPFIYFYVIINKALTDSSTEAAIAGVVSKGAEDFINDQIKDLLNPSSHLNILGIFETSIVVDGGGGPFLIASLIGAAVAAGLDAALSALFANCDGLVASGTVAYLNGRSLQQQLQNAPGRQITGQIHSPGTDSTSGCGGNSDYTVTYYIQGS